jgi:RNA polymerase sigma factor (sigma-70 family)
MRRRGFGISTPNIQRKGIDCDPQLSAPSQGAVCPTGPLITETGDYIPKDFADWREISSEALERKELRNALASALHSLPEKYRTVMMLRDVQQLSIAETAQVLGISEANVRHDSLAPAPK